MNTAARSAVHNVIGLLVDGQYDVLAAMTRSFRMTATEIREAVTLYPGTLTHIPIEMLCSEEVWDQVGTDPSTLTAVVDLWTVEEGRSDLTLEARLTEIDGGVYGIEILDIHTL